MFTIFLSIFTDDNHNSNDKDNGFNNIKKQQQ